MVKFLMHGCNGKMGRMITEIVKGDENAVIAAGVDSYTEVANEYPVFDSIEKCDTDVDVVIDFSTAKAVDGLLDYCVAKKLPVVLCTTGLSEEQLKKSGGSVPHSGGSEVGKYVSRHQPAPEAYQRCGEGACTGRI